MTAKELFSKVKSPTLRDKLLKNLEEHSIETSYNNYEKLSQAMTYAFVWTSTSENMGFWMTLTIIQEDMERIGESL